MSTYSTMDGGDPITDENDRLVMVSGSSVEGRVRLDLCDERGGDGATAYLTAEQVDALIDRLERAKAYAL